MKMPKPATVSAEIRPALFMMSPGSGKALWTGNRGNHKRGGFAKLRAQPVLSAIQFFGFREQHPSEIIPNCIFIGINLSDSEEMRNINEAQDGRSVLEENIFLWCLFTRGFRGFKGRRAATEKSLHHLLHRLARPTLTLPPLDISPE